jgi:nucleoside-diphosphate-sugar epimerase
MNGRVLVTGGTGFIGRWAVASLAAKGYEVHVCARHARCDFSVPAQVHAVDLLKQGSGERLLTEIQPTHLLHLAWVTTHGDYWTSEENLQWVGLTLNLVRTAVAVGCRRIVAVGTCAEYDWDPGGVVDEQRSSLQSGSLYGTAKAATFRTLQAYSLRADVSFAWARVFYEYGPYEHPDRLVPAVIRAVLAGVPVPCSHGEQLRDFLCSVDAGEALAALLDSHVTGPVNIGSGQPIRLRELVVQAARIAGDSSLVRLGVLPARAGEPLVLIPTVARLHREVGWTPRFTLEEGLTRTVEFWRGLANNSN